MLFYLCFFYCLGHVNSQRTPESDGERDVNGIPGPGPGDSTPHGISGGRPVPKPRSVYGEAQLQEKSQFRKADRWET